MRRVRPLPELQSDSSKTELIQQHEAVEIETKRLLEVDKAARGVQVERLRNLKERHRQSELKKDLLRQQLEEERERENTVRSQSSISPSPPSAAVIGGPLERSLWMAQEKLSKLDHEWDSSMREAKRQMKSIELQRILNGESNNSQYVPF